MDKEQIGLEPECKYEVTCSPIQNSFEMHRILSISSGEEPLILGRTNVPAEIAENNLLFASRVVSRKHAELLVIDGMLYIRDAKSSRLSQRGVGSEEYMLKSGDIIRLGDDCEVNGTPYFAVVIQITFKDGTETQLNSAELLQNSHMTGSLDSQINLASGLQDDPDLKKRLELELQQIWNGILIGTKASPAIKNIYDLTKPISNMLLSKKPRMHQHLDSEASIIPDSEKKEKIKPKSSPLKD